MQIKYKLLILSPLFGIMPSCVFHKNIVVENRGNILVLEDIEDHQYRLIQHYDTSYVSPFFKYTQQNDTVLLRSRFYDKDSVFRNSKDAYLYVHGDSISNRIKREENDSIKLQMMKSMRHR